MVFSAGELQRQLEHYLRAVRRHYSVERATLFGSYAKGRPHAHSDIDLVVISPDFRGIPKIERHQKLGLIAWQAETDYIEPLGFTSEEYENASRLGLLGEVKETGIVVYEAAPRVGAAVREQGLRLFCGREFQNENRHPPCRIRQTPAPAHFHQAQAAYQRSGQAGARARAGYV
ncbi:MAG: nucleotidyltransferase domain-containing protein [Anaerolineales bacterium]